MCAFVYVSNGQRHFLCAKSRLAPNWCRVGQGLYIPCQQPPTAHPGNSSVLRWEKKAAKVGCMRDYPNYLYSIRSSPNLATMLFLWTKIADRILYSPSWPPRENELKILLLQPRVSSFPPVELPYPPYTIKCSAGEYFLTDSLFFARCRGTLVKVLQSITK